MKNKLITEKELKRELQAYEKVKNHLETQIKYYRKKHLEEQEKFAKFYIESKKAKADLIKSINKLEIIYKNIMFNSLSNGGDRYE